MAKLASAAVRPHIWGMSSYPTPLERAFELARSGECESITEVRKRLRDEGLSVSQLEGPMLTRQIRDLCAEAILRRDAESANESSKAD